MKLTSLFKYSVIALSVLSCTANATSYYVPPNKNKQAVASTSGNTVESAFNLYPYPEPEKVYKTGILFFYTPELLDYYGGDILKIYDFIDESIAVNNDAFRYAGVGIERVSVGLLPMPTNRITFDNENMYVNTWYYDAERQTKYYFKDLQMFEYVINGTDSNRVQTPITDYEDFSASYYVALAKRYEAPEGANEDDYRWVGMAWLGGKLSIVTPYSNKKHQKRVLAHELGHNDGLAHKKDEIGSTPDYYMLPDGVGYQCGNYASIMFEDGDRDVYHLFSDANRTLAAGNTPCGEAGVSDAAAAYRRAVEGGSFVSKTETYQNIRDINPIVGEARIVLIADTFSETGSIEGEVHWEGLQPGDKAHVEVSLAEWGDADVADFADVPSVPLNYEGEPVSTFKIRLNNDSEFELPEKTFLTLRSPNGVTVAEDSKAMPIYIESDEAGNVGTFAFEQASYSVEEGKTVTLKINRTGGSDGTVELDVKTVAGTATEGDDYYKLETKVIFNHGETVKTVNVGTRVDSIDEPSETLSLVMSNEKVTIGQSTATITIKGTTKGNGNGSSSSDSGGSLGFLGLLTLLGVLISRKNI
jgi:hypothetical protein